MHPVELNSCSLNFYNKTRPQSTTLTFKKIMTHSLTDNLEKVELEGIKETS
ncbi:MAG: hypothetical protein OP8BY_0382 [Candidatus Saccharicenans subterraneus]|uniref:Uncharacterized protein n=1 Tax=Candidatus Saccharicenans subterraneus TaxID=2508984 RepID=A0A3E2BLF0_9BACT|nr:MAG: hypothetical protein OP8BY_0382 [Candidatus Saccharicenans subterraneum]